MEGILLERSALLSLMELKGLDAFIGVGPEQLSVPEPFERPIVLDDGRSWLLERKHLSVDRDHYEIDAQLDALLSVIAEPEAVMRNWRSTGDQGEELWCWYFLTGSDLVQLVTSGREHFEISRLPDRAAAMAQLGEIFPLEPMSETVHYLAIVDQEDNELVRVLVSGWKDIPALTLLEADGLTPVETTALLEDVADPVWHGGIDFLASAAGKVKIHHRLLLLQGQERSWLAWQADPDKSDLHIQAASAGAFEDQLAAYWSEVAPKASE